MILLKVSGIALKFYISFIWIGLEDTIIVQMSMHTKLYPNLTPNLRRDLDCLGH